MEQFRFSNLPYRILLRCGLPAGTMLLASLLYLCLLPGDFSMEPGARWKIPLSLLLYSGTLSVALLMNRRPARLIYFAFPLVLVLEEALNFAPIDQYYASGQIPFALLLAAWCWSIDAAIGETIAVKFRSLAWLPTLLIGGMLYLPPSRSSPTISLRAESSPTIRFRLFTRQIWPKRSTTPSPTPPAWC
ncbi:MAG: hypothetical protein L6W00_29160 [Lentisphaeria bacterium]|nr:MAG: hypothetical protein L6W00_29160 [Lentisphaeria bacterium]